jgi:hypothetical protein
MSDLVEPIRAGAIASEKELEMHGDMLEAQGCPRCGHHTLVQRRRTPTAIDVVREIVWSCSACDGRWVIAYSPDEGWDDQPGYDEPRLTNRRRPSALIPASYLYERVERSAEQVSRHAGGLAAVVAAKMALEAIDELEKHQRYAVPNRRNFTRMKSWLRATLRA